MSLTWEKEGSVKPIAKVIAEDNAEWNKRVLYISDKPPKPLKDGNKAFQILGLDFFKHGRLGRMITKEDIQWIKETLHKALGGDEGKHIRKKARLAKDEKDPLESVETETSIPREKRAMLEKVIDQALIELKKRHGRSVSLPPGCHFIPICNTVKEQRDCIFIFGPSGSGKSVWCKIYAKQWKRQHPDGQIYIISQKKQDKSLDSLEMTQIELDDGFVKDPPQLEELAHSLVIFDDYGAIADPVLKKAVKNFQDKLLHLSRQDAVDLLITTHVALNWNQTKNIQGDASAVVGFPHAGAWREMEEVLRKYSKMTKDELDRIHTVRSRWAMVERVAPCYVLSETSAWINE